MNWPLASNLLITLWQNKAYGSPMAMTLRVVVPPHPLIAHWLTMLRETTTPSPLYSKGLEQLGKWLTYEAIRDWLPRRKEEITTSQGETEGTVIEARIPLLALPINPGGLELWYGGREVLPNTELCIGGGIPDSIESNTGVVIYLDQITKGDDLLKIIELLNLKNVSPRRIRVVSVLAAKPGLHKIGEKTPDLNIYCACIDPELTQNEDINPGIGNTSMRINTKIVGLN